MIILNNFKYVLKALSVSKSAYKHINTLHLRLIKMSSKNLSHHKSTSPSEVQSQLKRHFATLCATNLQTWCHYGNRARRQGAH